MISTKMFFYFYCIYLIFNLLLNVMYVLLTPYPNQTLPIECFCFESSFYVVGNSNLTSLPLEEPDDDVKRNVFS